MARGKEGIPALEMTKWFDTNYHYLVPEISSDILPADLNDFLETNSFKRFTIDWLPLEF
jgi:5-methyltetrahydropteroyltriglutamate--homocysteine methyltransferase